MHEEIDADSVTLCASLTGLEQQSAKALLKLFESDVNSAAEYYYNNADNPEFLANLYEQGEILAHAPPPPPPPPPMPVISI